MRAAWIVMACLLTGAANAQSGCVEIQSTQGWQSVQFFGAPVDIATISGSWTVDAAISRSGYAGHQGADAQRLEPFSAYKYDQNYAFGQLLLRAQGRDQVIAPRPSIGNGQVTRIWGSGPVEFRINDADAALGDNAGVLTVCVNPVGSEAATSPASSAPSTANGAASAYSSTTAAPAERAAGRSEWMACFNDSRENDSESRRLRRWRSEIRSTERALERRADGLQDERNHLSYSYNRDAYGIADRARANQERMHQERVDAYNDDVDDLQDELDDYNRDASDHDAWDDALRARCGGVLFDNSRELAQQYCVGNAASTSFCEAFD